MYQKRLVPLDGSELADGVLTHARDLLKEGTAGEVILVNGVNVSFTVPNTAADEISDIINNHSIRKDLFIKSEMYLKHLKSRLASEGIQVKTVSLEGSRPADTSAEYGQKNGVDLMVIVPHGYTGLKRLTLGSVALEILHEASIPVLLIRPAACRA